MKKPFLISTLTFATILSGIPLSTTPAFADFLAPGERIAEVSELLELAPSALEEVETFCRENTEEWECSQTYFSNKAKEDKRYTALGSFLGRMFTISSFNLRERTMRVVYNSKDVRGMEPGDQELSEDTLKELRIGWSNPTSSWVIYSSGREGIPKNESSAPSTFHYLFNGSADTSDEGNWPTPYKEFTITWDDLNFEENATNIQYAVHGQKQSYTAGHFITSCLTSKYYEPGMECRAVFSETAGDIPGYLPFKDGVPAYPHSDYVTSTESTTPGDSEGTPNQEGSDEEDLDEETNPTPGVTPPVDDGEETDTPAEGEEGDGDGDDDGKSNGVGQTTTPPSIKPGIVRPSDKDKTEIITPPTSSEDSEVTTFPDSDGNGASTPPSDNNSTLGSEELPNVDRPTGIPEFAESLISNSTSTIIPGTTLNSPKPVVVASVAAEDSPKNVLSVTTAAMSNQASSSNATKVAEVESSNTLKISSGTEVAAVSVSDDFAVPLGGGEEENSEALSFAWWLIAPVLAGVGVLAYFFWPKRSKRA